MASVFYAKQEKNHLCRLRSTIERKFKDGKFLSFMESRVNQMFQ